MKKILVAGFASLLSCVNQYSAPKQYDIAEAKIKLAQCLAQEATFFGAYWCPPCVLQERTFGPEAWNVFKESYIECSERSSPEEHQICSREDFEKIPFWKFKNGEKINGYKTLEQLAELSGCDY
ncbi:MAG: hypothetical protein AABW53_02330 [Nanoarchaeota archaeon]